ncbi:MAG: CDP-diacylglycerol--serine O-phosphatidyltransferase [Acidobacteriota bacterium]
MKITRAVVPSLFTVLNMFCGFLSIVQSSDGRFESASYFIILAGVFDSLDGFMARLTKTSSQFGVEIDSLSDVVSFGAAPAFMAYKIHLIQWEGYGLLISSLLLLLGGIRLARFNVQLVGFDKDHFTGLPIPASAIAVIAYVLTFGHPSFNAGEAGRLVLSGAAAQWFAPMIVVVSLLMVSTVKYDTLPKFSKRDMKKHPVKIGAFAAAAVITIVSKGAMLFYLFMAFIAYGIIRYCVLFIRRMAGPEEAGEEQEEAEEATGFDL